MIDPTTYSDPKAIKRAIIVARPRIERVNRIAGWAVPVLGTLNILLGLSLYSLKSLFAGEMTILNSLLSYQLWGAIFLLAGLAMWGSFINNNWKVMRGALAFMVAVSFIWIIALVFRAFFFGYGNFIVLILWSGLTALKVIIYLFFFPEVPAPERRLAEGESHAV